MQRKLAPNDHHLFGHRYFWALPGSACMCFLSIQIPIQPKCHKTTKSYIILWLYDTEMNSTALRMMTHVMGGTHDAKSLMDILGIREWQFNEHVKKLVRENYVKKDGGMISLQNNAKAGLLLAISRKYDIEGLLHDSNEQILALLTEPLTINQICTSTGLSSRTVYRAISDFESIGIIDRRPDRDGGLEPRTREKIRISPTHDDLITFAKILKTEQDSLHEPNASIIFKTKDLVLKKVLGGKTTEGETTAYSLFSDYGVQYSSPYEYYVKQDSPLDLHDVLIHSIVAAHESKDKLGLIMAIVFYVKNREKFDTIKLRDLSMEFEISSVWLDVEGYLRGRELKNPELFLPWEEFVSKAQLYNIPPEDYTLPGPAPTLFADIAKNLSTEMTVYLIGGENMRLKNLKGATKDCDMVVESHEDFQRLRTILTAKLGYSAKPAGSFSTEDQRLFPDDILEHAERSRIDLFTKKILHAAVLSPDMIKRADAICHGKLTVTLLRNEDVFLLKAVASREGDIQDMALLVRGGSHQPTEYQHGVFDWDVVWKEILIQEHMNHLRDFTADVFQQLGLLSEQTGITAPFLDKFKRHVLDRLIKRILRGGPQPFNYVVDLLVGGDISDKIIRNRVDALERDGTLSKKRTGRDVDLSLTHMPTFPEPSWDTKLENLKIYLDWRFPHREKSPDRIIREFSDELADFGYANIGTIDEIVLRALSTALRYESEHLPKIKLTATALARICIKLINDSIGNINGYRISELGKYRMIVQRPLENEAIQA